MKPGIVCRPELSTEPYLADSERGRRVTVGPPAVGDSLLLRVELGEGAVGQRAEQAAVAFTPTALFGAVVDQGVIMISRSPAVATGNENRKTLLVENKLTHLCLHFLN